jgi:hypothetical protein
MIATAAGARRFVFLMADWGERMTDRKKRERVVAEITLPHLVQLAEEIGIPMTREAALAFLNQEGRAYDMWKRMMQAGEDFIKLSLRNEQRTATLRPAPPSRLAV